MTIQLLQLVLTDETHGSLISTGSNDGGSSPASVQGPLAGREVLFQAVLGLSSSQSGL